MLNHNKNKCSGISGTPDSKEKAINPNAGSKPSTSQLEQNNKGNNVMLESKKEVNIYAESKDDAICDHNEVGPIKDIKEALHGIEKSDEIIKICKQKTKNHVESSCQKLLDIGEERRILQRQEDKLKKRVVSILLYDSVLREAEGGPEEFPDDEQSQIDLVYKSGLPEGLVDDIVEDPRWRTWLRQ